MLVGGKVNTTLGLFNENALKLYNVQYFNSIKVNESST